MIRLAVIWFCLPKAQCSSCDHINNINSTYVKATKPVIKISLENTFSLKKKT